LKLLRQRLSEGRHRPRPDDLAQARAWLTHELHITQPGIVVAMGEGRRRVPGIAGVPRCRRRSSSGSARCGRSPPTIDLLAVPDIDSSLNDSAAKREFWAAFKALGEWYDNLPPY
jgi:uracil-DNA glycosylase